MPGVESESKSEAGRQASGQLEKQRMMEETSKRRNKKNTEVAGGLSRRPWA